MYENIKIDIDVKDRRRLPSRVRRAGWLLREIAGLWNISVDEIRVYRTAHGAHLIAGMEGLVSPWQIVALQAIAGSDSVREMMNGHRIAEGWSHWNVAFTERTKDGPDGKRSSARVTYSVRLTAAANGVRWRRRR